MRKVGCSLVLLLLAGLSTLWWMRPVESESPLRETGPVHEIASVRPAAAAHVTRGQVAEAPDEAVLGAARRQLGPDARRQSCGPYALYTDVKESRLLTACGRLAGKLDALYEERYGVRPVGLPAEAIVLFADIGDYRAFARASGVPLGYAGYALGARGVAVFYAEDQPLETFLKTLTHELTHLLNRRALGVNLPPWLSEGLADGIGDTATEQGFQPLIAVRGSEAQAQRLRTALASGRAGSLAKLVNLDRGDFDEGTVTFDYEQSALLVRFLLSEPALASGFRGFLRDLAAGKVRDIAGELPAALGAGWTELDRRFGAWAQQTR